MIFTVGNHLQHQHQPPRPGHPGRSTARRTCRFEIGHEIRLADQVGQRLPPIARGRQGKVGFGPFVDPLSMCWLPIERNDAIGQCLERPHESLQGFRSDCCKAYPHTAMQSGKSDLPYAAATRQRISAVPPASRAIARDGTDASREAGGKRSASRGSGQSQLNLTGRITGGG